MKNLNRHQVTLYGTQKFLDWLKSVKPELHRWNIQNVNHRPASYLIEMEDQNCHGLVLETYFKSIIENELTQHFYVPRQDWPTDITFDLFQTWFTYQYHEEVYDLSSAELEVFD